MEYGNLKMRLSGAYQNDRLVYTQAKSEFILQVTEAAKRYYRKAQQGKFSRRKTPRG
jgi:hypothetical protein